MEELKKTLKELVQRIGIKEDVKLKILPMKQKIASLSFSTKTLKLNQKVIKFLDDKQLKYILLHELIHLKIKDVNHGSFFFRELEKYCTLEEIYNLETKLIEKLIINKVCIEK